MQTRRPALLALLALAVVAIAGLSSCDLAKVDPGQTAVNAAKKQIGQPYVVGGESRAEGGFDCSGLTYYAWKQAGVTLPRSSAAQWKGVRRVVHQESLRPGDLVFYSSSSNATVKSTVTHVALYEGNGMIIQAHRPGEAIDETKLAGYWKGHLVGYGRVDPPGSTTTTTTTAAKKG